ncbi:unnamed protein product [Arctia plantaginis]|uniref:Uncharacterized protein n=1 Tax=Arctia plantaginis TaxID=874455 RepID=A0A8S1AH84_ARCPL|nr:unnamed protein product [Arctia plantaginis]
MALEHGQKFTLKLKKRSSNIPVSEKDKLPPERKFTMKRKRQAPVQEALAKAALTETYLPKAGPSTASISEGDLLAAGPSTTIVPYHK